MCAYISAIIAAGGVGARFGGSKQFEDIFGATMLERSVSAFLNYGGGGIQSVIIACPKAERERVARLFADIKRLNVIVGGKTRAESVLAAISIVPKGTRYILIHDAARPLISQEVIANILAGLSDYPAIVPVKPITDTVVRVEGGMAGNYLSREGLFAVSTPQGFRADVIEQAYAAWLADGKPPVTDDSTIARLYLGISAKTISDDVANIKITSPGDLEIARRLFPQQNRSTTPIED